MASFGFQMNLFVVMLVLMCNVLQIRVVLTNEEALQNDFVSIPLHYGMDEEVENIKNEGSGEEDENDGITKHEQIQIIQKSPDKMTKVPHFNSVQIVSIVIIHHLIMSRYFKQKYDSNLGWRCCNLDLQIERSLGLVWVATT